MLRSWRVIVQSIYVDGADCLQNHVVCRVNRCEYPVSGIQLINLVSREMYRLRMNPSNIYAYVRNAVLSSSNNIFSTNNK